MSKMLRNILIMIAMVVVAVGAILLTSNLGKDDEEIAVEPTQDPTQHIYVDYSIEDIVDITVENESGSYTLYRTESSNFGDEQQATEPGEAQQETAEGEPQNEEQQPEQTAEEQVAQTAEPQEAADDLVWKIKGSESTDLDQSDASSLARYASYLYIEEVITEDMSRKAEFGLADYSAKVTATFTDGTTKVYYYGNQVPAEPAYYMYLEGVEKVFTVSSTYGFNVMKSALDLYSLSGIGITANDISEIKLERDGSVVFHTVPAINKVGLVGIDMIEPFWHMVNSNVLIELNTEIEQIAVDGVIDTSGNFGKYGLDNPWGKLTVTSKSGYTSVFMVGDEIDESYTACSLEGDSNIYKIDTSALGVFNHNAYQLIDKYLAMVNILNVDKVVFSRFGFENVELLIEKIPQLDENGEPKLGTTGEPVYDNVFHKNGDKLPDEQNEQGTWYYQSLIVPMSSSLIMPDEFSTEGLEPVATIAFDLSIEPGTYTVEFYEFNADFYAVSINGQKYLHKVSDSEVEKLIESTNQFVEGEIVRPY